MRHEPVKTECPLEVMAAIGPFGGELMTNDHAAAIARLESLSPLDAVRLVLATYRRSDSFIHDHELDALAEALGCFWDVFPDAINILECEKCPPIDRLRMVLRSDIISERHLRELACIYAESALQKERDAGREPDRRSWAVIEVAGRFARGDATHEELSAARAAAIAAENATNDAAAYVASCSAYFVAAEIAADAASFAMDHAASRDVHDASARAADHRAAHDAAIKQQIEQTLLFLKGSL